MKVKSSLIVPILAASILIPTVGNAMDCLHSMQTIGRKAPISLQKLGIEGVRSNII